MPSSMGRSEAASAEGAKAFSSTDERSFRHLREARRMHRKVRCRPHFPSNEKFAGRSEVASEQESKSDPVSMPFLSLTSLRRVSRL